MFLVGCSPVSYADIDVTSGEEECVESRDYTRGGPYYPSGDECSFLLRVSECCDRLSSD